MSIDAIKAMIAGIQPINKSSGETQQIGSQGGKEFSKVLTDSLQEVDALQKDADNKIRQVSLSGDESTSHEAMLALEKADIAFQLMSAVRGKIIKAYEEVLRTQV